MFVNQIEAAIHGHMFGEHLRGAEIVLGRQNRLANIVDVAVHDPDGAVLAAFVAEQLQLFRQILGEVVTHETEVIVLGAYLERLLKAIRLHDLFPHDEAQVIGVYRQGSLLAGSVGTDHV